MSETEQNASVATDYGHAKFSASGSERWSKCPGSVAMEDGKPDDNSEYADEGTAAHTLATLTFNDPDRRAHAFLGRHIQVNNADGTLRRSFVVDQDMGMHVQTYVNNVLKAVGGGVLLIEQKVPISHITEEAGATGVSDAVGIADTELQVHDLKFGMGVRVHAKENSQLLMYADGVLVELADLLGDIETVRMVIHQPRLDHVDEWVIPVAEVKARIKALHKAADLAQTARTFKSNWFGQPADENGVFDYLVPGEEQCRFCKAKATCPALAAFVDTSIADDFADLEIDIKPGADDTEATLLSRKMLATDLIENWITAVRAEVERKLLASEPVPGFKLVQGKRGNRKWKDEVEAEKTLKAMRLKTEEVYKMTVNSPTVIETYLKKAHPRQWKTLQPMIGQADGQPHVAPESDKRPAITIASTADDFTDLEGAGDNADLAG